MKVLGIDASLRGTGLAVIEQTGSRTAAQLRGALRAEELTLPDEIRTALDEVSA